jgi:hypothetical protein
MSYNQKEAMLLRFFWTLMATEDSVEVCKVPLSYLRPDAPFHRLVIADLKKFEASDEFKSQIFTDLSIAAGQSTPFQMSPADRLSERVKQLLQESQTSAGNCYSLDHVKAEIAFKCGRHGEGWEGAYSHAVAFYRHVEGQERNFPIDYGSQGAPRISTGSDQKRSTRESITLYALYCYLTSKGEYSFIPMPPAALIAGALGQGPPILPSVRTLPAYIQSWGPSFSGWSIKLPLMEGDPVRDLCYKILSRLDLNELDEKLVAGLVKSYYQGRSAASGACHKYHHFHWEIECISSSPLGYMLKGALVAQGMIKP